jgi:WhiB family redox-sensing transcriptional regulator
MNDHWKIHGACHDHDQDLWFPSPGPDGYAATARAKAICATCPVKRACLEAGLREHHGIWGGLTERERRRVRRQRAQAGVS